MAILQSDISLSSEDIINEVTDEPSVTETDNTGSNSDSLLGEDQEEQSSNQTDNTTDESEDNKKTAEQNIENNQQSDDSNTEQTENIVDENLSSDETDQELAEKSESPNQNNYVEVESDDGTVEVYSSIDLMKSYKERRESNGWYLSAGVENFTPLMYKSTIDDQFYDVLFFDDAIQMTTLTAYYKWNTRVGSVGLGYEYAQGSIYNTDDDINLDIVRTGLGFMFAFDMMNDEPKYVPYFKFHIDKHDFIEDRPTEDRYYGEITGIGYGYGLGLMIQMDQFDKESSRNSYAEWGIQNTFLDLALNWQEKSSNADDQNFETETSDPGLSAALRLEF